MWSDEREEITSEQRKIRRVDEDGCKVDLCQHRMCLKYLSLWILKLRSLHQTRKNTNTNVYEKRKRAIMKGPSERPRCMVRPIKGRGRRAMGK